MDSIQTKDDPKEENLLKKINDLFDDLGAGDISEEEKGALLAKMVDLAMGRALHRISEKLSSEQLDELDKILEMDDFEKTEEYLKDIVPDYDQIFLDEANKLREELKIDLGE